MKLSHFILIFFMTINAFSQADLEQIDIINNKFLALLRKPLSGLANRRLQP
jgi:hypothetical protein